MHNEDKRLASCADETPTGSDVLFIGQYSLRKRVVCLGNIELRVPQRRVDGDLSGWVWPSAVVMCHWLLAIHRQAVGGEPDAHVAQHVGQPSAREPSDRAHEKGRPDQETVATSAARNCSVAGGNGPERVATEPAMDGIDGSPDQKKGGPSGAAAPPLEVCASNDAAGNGSVVEAHEACPSATAKATATDVPAPGVTAVGGVDGKEGVAGPCSVDDAWPARETGAKRVRAVEVGCGCALSGMFAAALGWDVVVTDLPSALPHTRAVVAIPWNREQISKGGGSVVARPCDWNDGLLDVDLSGVDYILASDCIHQAPLHHSLAKLLSSCLSKSSATVLMTAQLRKPLAERSFFGEVLPAYGLAPVAFDVSQLTSLTEYTQSHVQYLYAVQIVRAGDRAPAQTPIPEALEYFKAREQMEAAAEEARLEREANKPESDEGPDSIYL
ncbi:hypothetical protein DIPPA_17994 [Diplonema papillatum]|nr:hypothetical protein DIPPA_17994 [Diplonema papillatum]|eukprot:gene675-1035_t